MGRKRICCKLNEFAIGYHRKRGVRVETKMAARAANRPAFNAGSFITRQVSGSGTKNIYNRDGCDLCTVLVCEPG